MADAASRAFCGERMAAMFSERRVSVSDSSVGAEEQWNE